MKRRQQRSHNCKIGNIQVIVAIALLVIALSAPSANAECNDIARSVDFNNHQFPVLKWDRDTVPTFRPAGTSNQVIKLRSGSYSQPVYSTPVLDEDDPFATLNSVVYGDITGDGCPEAIVAIHVKSGGTLSWGYLYVYSEIDAKLKLISSFLLGDRGSEGFDKAQIVFGKLIVQIFDPDLRDGDCCSDGVIKITLTWNGSQLKEVDRVKSRK